MEYDLGEKIDAIRKERGLSAAKLSEMTGIPYNTVRRHLNNRGVGVKALVAYCNALGVTVTELFDPTLDLTQFTVTDSLYDRYPWNFIARAVGIEEGNTEALYEYYIPAVFESLEEIGCHSERALAVVEYRYKNRLTLKAVSELIGRTPERVRQIEERALRVFRSRYLKKCRAYGKDRCEQAERRVRELEEQLVLAHKALSEAINDNLNNHVIEPEEVYGQLIHRGIEELGLSVRSYNCLRRDGIKTLFDLICHTPSELASIRNLGKKSAEEIIKTVEARGLRLKQEAS